MSNLADVWFSDLRPSWSCHHWMIPHRLGTIAMCFPSLDGKLRVDGGSHFWLGHGGREVRHRKVCVSTSDIFSNHRGAMSACAHVTGSTEDARELHRVSWQRKKFGQKRTSTQTSCSHVLGCAGVSALTAYDLEHVLVAGNISIL